MAHPQARRRAVWLVQLLAALVVIVAVVFGRAPAAAAHANLVSTDPTAETVVDAVPETVTLQFDGPVSLDLGAGIKVFGPNGQRVDRGVTELGPQDRSLTVPIDDAGRGTYTVGWKAISGDSHVLSGSFLFHVEERTGSRAELEAERPGLRLATWGAQWMIFAGMIVLGGVAAYRLALRPDVDLAGRRVRAVVRLAAAVLLGGSVARLVLFVAEASGRPVLSSFGLVIDSIRDTRVGLLAAIRAAAAVVGVAAAVWWRSWWTGVLAAAVAAGVAVVNALSGHAWTAPDRLLAVTSDIVHQLAATVWIGGLVGLLLAVHARRERAGWLFGRFSRLALGAVLAVVVSGAISGWQQLGAAEGLWTTTYGRVLLAKMAVVAVVVALGWWQRTRLARSVEHAAGLLGAARGEAVLAVGVLALTGVLVGISPGREAVSGPFTERITDTAGFVDVTVAPARVGTNLLHLYFYGPDGLPRTVDAAEARVGTADVPPRRIDLVPVTPNHFSAPAFDLPVPGEWTFTITTLSRGIPADVSFEVSV